MRMPMCISQTQRKQHLSACPIDYREPWIDDDGFVRFRTGDERRTPDIVESTFRVIATLTTGKVRPWLVDARAMTSAEPRAWLAITERLTAFASALAILKSDEPVSRHP
jgi:hypothetical protein